MKTSGAFSLVLVALVICFLTLTWVSSSAADLTNDGEVGGLQCSTCGSECKVLCASRQTRLFRSCCLNFMRKRSGDPYIQPYGTNNLNIHRFL